jgi:hypothetical protein
MSIRNSSVVRDVSGRVEGQSRGSSLKASKENFSSFLGARRVENDGGRAQLREEGRNMNAGRFVLKQGSQEGVRESMRGQNRGMLDLGEDEEL